MTDIFKSQSRVKITPNFHICEELPFLNWELSKNKFEFPIVNKEKVLPKKQQWALLYIKRFISGWLNVATRLTLPFRGGA